MFRFAFVLPFAVIFKELHEIFQRLLFPFVYLIRMGAVFGSNLCDALFFSDYFQDDLSFLLRSESCSFGHVGFLQNLHLNYARFRV